MSSQHLPNLFIACKVNPSRGRLPRRLCRHWRSLCNGHAHVLRIQLSTCHKLWRKARKFLSCKHHHAPYSKRINGIFPRIPGQAQYSWRQTLRQILSDRTRRIADIEQHRHCRLPDMLFAFDSSFQYSDKDYPSHLGFHDRATWQKGLCDNAHCSRLLLGFYLHAC